MKKLILLFRKSQYSRILIFGFVLLGACTAAHKEPLPLSGSVSEKAAAGPINVGENLDQELVTPVLGQIESQIHIHPAFSPDGGYSITPVPRTFCSFQSFPISINLPVIVNLQNETNFVRILGPMDAITGLVFEVDFNEGQNKFWIPASTQQVETLNSMLCDQNPGEEQRKKFRDVLSYLLESVAPDCHFRELAGEGFSCELASMDAEAALGKLKKMQKDILRKWKRQPYLFLRRLTITKQLAQLILNRSQFDETEQFCSLLSLSHAKELPLVMRSKSWQDGLCQSSAVDSLRWGEVGIDQATRELSFFQKLLDKSNRLGQLRVKIPHNLHRTKELWVQIQPDQDVAEQVLATALDMNPFRDFGDKERLQLHGMPLRASTSCWNPLYHNDSSSLGLATLMLLSGNKPSLCYQGDASDEHNLTQTSYLYEGIIGETSFVVDNGRYKVLHLPMGTYNYTIVNLPPNSKRWAPLKLKDQSKGAFAWSSKRPRPQIKTW